MRLSDFIQDTLYEIALGVELGRARAKDLIAINPSALDGEPIGERSYIDFDVSVVVGEKDASQTFGTGKIGGEIKVVSVFSASAEAGGGKQVSSTRSKEQTHRVAFKVPVHMNANYANNPAAAENAERLLAQHTREP
jgi:hypothetical protein